MLAELHVHLYGCVRPVDLLEHLAASESVRWDWYEANFEAAFGEVPSARQVVERFRQGDASAAAEFEELCVVNEADAGTFQRFSAKTNLWFAGQSLGDDPNQLEREVLGFASGIRADLVRQGIAYAEFRHAPYVPLLAAYDNDGDGPIQRVAASVSRSDPWPEWERIKEVALGPHGQVLTGVDFCNVEEGFPPKDKAAFFADVLAFNEDHPERAQAILYHVGESFSDKSLESAIRWVQEAAELGAHRLGHAIALGADPRLFGVHTRQESVAERRDQIAYDLAHHDGLRAAGVPIDREALSEESEALASSPEDSRIDVSYDPARLAEVRRRQDYAMARVRATGAVIEVCPTSNRLIAGITDADLHPVHRFLAAGLPTVVSSDDPGMFATTLAKELDWVCQATGGGDDLRQHLVQTAWRSRSESLVGRVAEPGFPASPSRR